MEKLFQRLNIKPHNIDIFKKAFTHKSIANELGIEHYNMLEFLGDSILQFHSSNYIYQNYPKIDEGEATLLRSANVSTKALAIFSLEYELFKYIKISRGAEILLQSSKIQADLFESFIAALYLDQGEKVLLDFFKHTIFKSIDESYINKAISIKDPKTTFQEYVQHFSRNPVEYIVVKSEVTNLYVATLKHDNQIFGVGQGKNKKSAETAAATDALEKLSL